MNRHGGTLNTWVNGDNSKRLHTAWFQLCDILQKAKLWRPHKDQQLPQGKGKGGTNRQSTQDIQGSKTALYIIMVDTCVTIHLSKPIKCTKVNLNLNYGLWMIVMCQCRLIKANTRSPLVGMSTAGEAGCVGIMCGRSLYFPLSSAVALKRISKSKSSFKNFKHQQVSRKSVSRSRKYFQEPLHL